MNEQQAQTLSERIRQTHPHLHTVHVHKSNAYAKPGTPWNGTYRILIVQFDGPSSPLNSGYTVESTEDWDRWVQEWLENDRIEYERQATQQPR